MPSYDALKTKQTELIRKALDGSVFIAPVTAPAITNLTTGTGTGAATTIDLTTLPTGYEDLGYLTEDGVGISRETSQSDIRSWGSITPTRTDVLTDTSTISVTAQETNIFTLGLALGRDMSTVTGAVNTAEVSIAKPSRPSHQFYRLLVLAVDQADNGDVFIARFFPRVRVTAFGDVSFGGGDAPVEWPVTLSAFDDATLGYSERWIFGGQGWKGLMTEMGFAAVT